MKMQTVSMGMPVKIAIASPDAQEADIEEVFSYFHTIDALCSPYLPTSEVSKINAGKLTIKEASKELQHIFALCEETKLQTHEFFDIQYNGKIDPSGLVKGYAIWQGANLLRQKGYTDFFVEIAGDVEIAGKNEQGEKWKVGIENPFNRQEVIKIVALSDKGIATSGTYIRGTHIYNPKTNKEIETVKSISVIGPTVYDADRFATAAFAMGLEGLAFIESLEGYEAYLVTEDKKAFTTSGFDQFVVRSS